MASANTTKTANDKLIIFKGDDTGGVFGRRLAFTIEAGDGVDLSGCRAEWIFDGIVKTFAAPLIPGEVREVFYSHNETRCMALGVRYGTFRIIDAAGKVRTLTNTKPVEVTNDAARCYPGASDASFVVHGIGDMKHSEFADLEEKEGMTLKEVGGMVNTLIRKLKGTVSAFAALLAFGASCAVADGAITPQTDFGDISPTAKIGTVISDAGAVMTESDPTVYAWAKQPNPPKGMTDNALVLTNGIVKTANGSKTIGAADVGAVPLVEDVLGYKTAVTIGSRKSGEPVGPNSLANGNNVTASGHYSHAEGFYTTASGDNSRAEGNFTTAFGDYSHAEGDSTTAQGGCSHAEGGGTTASGYCSHAEGYYAHTKKQDQYAFAWNGDDTRSAPYESNGKGTFNINPVGGLNGFYIGEQTLHAILTNKADKADISATNQTFSNAVLAVGLNDEISSEMEEVRQIVTTWENFLDGSNVVFSITNYLSGTYSLDAAKMTIKELRDGEYREVYNSRDEILLHIQDFKDNDFKNATNQVIGAVNAAIGNKADKDWGKYTSAGGEAPANTVYMTAPNTVFAGGLEYERVAVGEGTICVLTTHGAPVWTQGDEGTFKFQDDGGTNYFGFTKTDSYTIGANTDGITVSGGMVTMNYNITMSGRPCVWYKADLTSNTPWEQLNLPNGSAVSGASHAVTWEQNPPAGTQVCYINVGNQPQGFFRATVEVAGEAKFMTNMPADLSGGIICPNTATGVNGVIKPTFNGTTVQWTWSAQ